MADTGKRVTCDCCGGPFETTAGDDERMCDPCIRADLEAEHERWIRQV